MIYNYYSTTERNNQQKNCLEYDNKRLPELIEYLQLNNLYRCSKILLYVGDLFVIKCHINNGLIFIGCPQPAQAISSADDHN